MNRKCTNQKMIHEFNLHKNEFVLRHFSVLRFEGIESDEHDSYYILREWGNRIHYDCSSKLIFLKDILTEKDYSRLVDSWKINKGFWEKNPDFVFMNINGDYIKPDYKTGEPIKIN